MSQINEPETVRTLRTLIDEAGDQPVESGVVFQILRGMLTALDDLHQAGGLHLGLRPEIICVGPALRVRLLPTGDGGEAPAGRPTYVSPEQALGVPDLDRRSDIYSLGIILWELLASPVGDVGRRIGAPELMKLRRRRLRQGLLDVVEAMVREDRESRLRGVEEVWQSLAWALDDSTADDDLAESDTRDPDDAQRPPAVLGPLASMDDGSPPSEGGHDSDPVSADLHSDVSGSSPIADAGSSVATLTTSAQPVPQESPRGHWARWLLAIAVVAAVLAVLGISTARGGEGAKTTDGDSNTSDPDFDLDPVPSGMPTLEDFGYYLGKLSEREKGNALNILSDLASDSRLDPGEVAGVLRRLLDEGKPPEGYGYGCGNCFLRRMSDLLGPLRLKGPQVNPPVKGVVVVRLDDGFLKRLKRESVDEVGGKLPDLVQALLDGYELPGNFKTESYTRYHGRGVDPTREPAFFTSADALADFEASLDEPMDAWNLARFMCTRPPRNQFAPGFLLLYFDPERTCTQVRIPTAADSENPDFRPSPASERTSGQTCGGAPEWVAPNIPLTEITSARYVPHTAYVEGIAKSR